MAQNTLHEKIILGVDPGTNILGYCVIGIQNRSVDILCIDILKLNKKLTHFEKLRDIFNCIETLIKSYHPHELSIEAPYFAKNVQSMLKLGRAQGAVILAATLNQIEIFEYSPRKIKQSITGKGNASKLQVALMLKGMYPHILVPKYLDETDALATAICHAQINKKSPNKSIQYASWKDFVNNNQNKITKN